jgi:hypothetical protein
MAITATHKTTGSSDANVSPFTTVSFTLDANTLGLAWVVTSNSSSPPVTPTVKFTNLAPLWTEVLSVSFFTVATPRKRLSLFRTIRASAVTDTVTIALTGTGITGCAWSITQFNGVETSGLDGSEAVRNVMSAAANNATTLSALVFGAFGSVNNAAAVGYGNELNPAAITPGTNWSELGDTGYANPTTGIETSWIATNDTTPGATWATADAGGVAVELVAESDAPAYVGSGAIAASLSAITPPLPGNLVTDDILLLFLMTNNQVITIPTPNGGTWTEVAGSPQGTGVEGADAASRLTVFWSRYNGTQGNPMTSDSGQQQIGRIHAFRGCIATGDPWDVTAGGVEGTSDTSGSIPGNTTTVANCLVVLAMAIEEPDETGTSQFSAWTNADLENITERSDNTSNVGNGGGLGVATGQKATAGTYGATAVTTVVSTMKAMMSIALKPPAAEGGGTTPQNFSGSLTPAGIVTRQTAKPFIGSI